MLLICCYNTFSMITSELVSFIKKQIQNNTSKDLIISKLLEAGWYREDINEGFLFIDKESKPIAPTPTPVIKETVKPINTQTEQEGPSTDMYRESVVSDSTIVESATPKENQPKVWIPKSMPAKEQDLSISNNPSTRVESTKVIIQNPELSSNKEEKLSKNLSPKSIDISPKAPIINKVEQLTQNNEFIPNLKQKIPKTIMNSSISSEPVIPVEKVPISPATPVNHNSIVRNLPKIPMLSSYPTDMISASKMKDKFPKKKIHRKIKWFIYALILLVLGLILLLSISVYINLRNSNFSFIKKDPRSLILNNSKVLSSLDSYKTETNIEISSPSFSDITYGLISGEAVSPVDKDSISINTLGILSKNIEGLFSDNFITIKSSVLPNYITTDIKSNGSELFVSVPDLSPVLENDAPEQAIVKINEQQFSLVPALFSENIESKLNKINLYKVLSTGMSSYVNRDTLSAYNEFINNVGIIEKDQENIKGINTYHYSVSIDRQTSKNLLDSISNSFAMNLSDEDKSNLTQILGSVTVDSFDVWVGKGDNNIYQYSFILNIPLSKIIGFEDKSIGDNKVSISWKTTYYDFNIPNNILMPDSSISMNDFVKKIKEMKMRNEVLSFVDLTKRLFDIEKSYGTKANTNGSCMNPSSGSLFSPLGHSKNTITAISGISEFLNKTLETTGGVGSCYSTTSAWSFAIPISDNYDTSLLPEGGYNNFFCVDSTGFSQNLESLPVDVVCK